MYFKTFSYRFAEEVLNSKIVIKNELENTIRELDPDLTQLSRPRFNEVLKEELVEKGWESQPVVFDSPNDPSAKMDFMKSRVGVEVEFGHSSFIGIDLLKFKVCSFSGLDRIDVGIYIVTTKNFQRQMREQYGPIWVGSLNYEKVVRYLPHFRSAIQVPVYVIGIDL